MQHEISGAAAGPCLESRNRAKVITRDGRSATFARARSCCDVLRHRRAGRDQNRTGARKESFDCERDLPDAGGPVINRACFRRISVTGRGLFFVAGELRRQIGHHLLEIDPLIRIEYLHKLTSCRWSANRRAAPPGFRNIGDNRPAPAKAFPSANIGKIQFGS